LSKIFITYDSSEDDVSIDIEESSDESSRSSWDSDSTYEPSDLSSDDSSDYEELAKRILEVDIKY
jgi:hypothetical protein